MERVTLSAAARKSFAERLGWTEFPDPSTQAFDDAIEDLRENHPDIYADVQNALEFKGEQLPVEREARLARRRARIQGYIDRLRNRRTHDGKQISDRRKILMVGMIGTFGFFVWMTYSTGFSNLFGEGRASARVTEKVEGQAATARPPQTPEPPDDGFGVTMPRTQLAANLNVPDDAPRVVQATSPTDLPPQRLQAQQNEPEESEAAASSSTDLPPRDPADLPPEPTVATAAAQNPPTNPYAPPVPTTPASGSAAVASTPTTPEVLPTALSFESTQANAPLPTTLSSRAPDPTSASTLADVGLSASQTETSETPAAPSSLTPEGEAAPGAAEILSWNLNTGQPNTTMVLTPETPEPLPAVPEVGQVAQGPQRPAAAPQPQPLNLTNTLPVGRELEAELVTAVAATGEQGVPVMAKTTGRWCDRPTCPDITWIGEASYDGAERVNIHFTQAVVGRTEQAVTATAFDTDRLPGIIARVGDGAPTAVQDLLRGAVGGAADYLNAVNTRTSTTVEDGVVVQEQAEPDLGNYLLGRSADLFALPPDRTGVVRYARLDQGKPITVLYGIRL